MNKPHLRAVAQADQPEERTRVCNIVFRCNAEHEFRCIRAIRAREHPRWSKSYSDFRVTARPVMRRVR